MEAWVWRSNSEGALPEVDFSHELSRVKSYRVTGSGFLDPESGPAVFVSESAARRDFVGLGAPVAYSYPLMSAITLRAFEEFVPADQFQAYPAEIHCRDGILDSYSVVRPLVTRACIDEDRSELKWSTHIPPLIDAYRKIALKPGCLGGLHFAREELMRWACFSPALREALVGFRGIPEQLRNPEEVSSPFW